jgi:hypothetical protein
LNPRKEKEDIHMIQFLQHFEIAALSKSANINVFLLLFSLVIDLDI